MERLNRRNLFKAALGAVGVAVVGKAAPEAVEFRNRSKGWLRMAEPGEAITSGYVPRGIPTIDDNIKPMRADATWVWDSPFNRGWPCTDEGMPSIYSTNDTLHTSPGMLSGTLTKHTAGPAGEVITNANAFQEQFQSVDAMFANLPPEALRVGNDVRALAEDYTDGWEEGEGFDA